MIMPIVAIAIANSDRLCRAVVLKSLSRQMIETMTQRLGGLVDRRIYFIPFSRGLHIDKKAVQAIHGLYKECMRTGGVLVAQPEHILSFKLIGIERLIAGDLHVGSSVITTQKWLDEHCRDILDESDELLDVKFQLIYSLGTQRMMDGQPDRWTLVMDIFDLIMRIVPSLAKDFANQVEVSQRTPSSFPALKLHSPDMAHLLISRLCNEIIMSQLPGLSMENAPSDVQKAVRSFIEIRDVGVAETELLERHYKESDAVLKKLLQLRGLFVHQVLAHVVRDKRYSVNYGLHLERCMSAVPFRAKGVPAPSAEFGHPDVALALTCLAHYYAGLTDVQIRKAFEYLERADDPSVEYRKWVEHCDPSYNPPASWHAVNLEDDYQCKLDLFPAVRYNKKIVDFYLRAIVFPKEGKEFDEKISSSGWDIPSSSETHLTTGFSGTNDNQFLLPLTIKQRDLPRLQHTSAKVIDLLLREENSRYSVVETEQRQQLSAQDFVKAINLVDRTVQVIIDVGAQILDVQNQGFVKAWLGERSDMKAGIYFDQDDTPMVITSKSRVEKLAASSFRSRMEECVVYMDEVHTRGTDIKLPPNARAVVTLGPRLTKDRLVQGMFGPLVPLGRADNRSLYAAANAWTRSESDVRRTTRGSS